MGSSRRISSNVQPRSTTSAASRACTSRGVAARTIEITPGPSGLWVISLGYLMDGPRGALLAAVAISLPPLAVLLLARIYQQVGHHPATQGFVQGLSLAVNGVFLVVLAGLLGANGVDLVAVAIVAGSVALGLARRVPVIVTLALAAAVGVVVYGGW